MAGSLAHNAARQAAALASVSAGEHVCGYGSKLNDQGMTGFGSIYQGSVLSTYFDPQPCSQAPVQVELDGSAGQSRGHFKPFVQACVAWAGAEAVFSPTGKADQGASAGSFATRMANVHGNVLV